MSLKHGSKIDRGYATVIEDDGVNYREIADTMTELGHAMNHSSARNNVLRVMKKFVEAICRRWGVKMTDARAMEIAKSPDFQHGITEVLQIIESKRRAVK